MKPSKIYLKIFLSFLLILIVTEIMIFTLFMIYIGRYFQEHDIASKARMVREIIEERISTVTVAEISGNEFLNSFIRNLGQLLGAQAWLQDEGGEILVKSFEGDPPKERHRLLAGRGKDFGDFRFYHGYGKGSLPYAVIPVTVKGGKKLSLHVVFIKQGPPHSGQGFALGLGIVGLVIAILVIPVSRLISKPINQLRHSAHRIAEGDLSHRAPVNRKDEIGRLAHSFNYMADKLEKMIRGGRELTAHISHELRTPLTRIRIAEEILRERLERKNYKDLEKYLDDIREDIEKLDGLIGRILLLSKLDIKEKPLTLHSFSIADLLRTLLEWLKPAIDQKGLHLDSKITFDPVISGDHDALQTAFSNILENAVKYSPIGGSIKVETRSIADNLDIIVTNTAEKIPEQDLEKIFEPFHRLGTGGEPGFGLGLAIVKKIIEAHGGTTEAHSEEKEFTIKVLIPLNPVEKG